MARTPWRIRLLLISGSLVVSFGVAELILRRVVPTTTHDELIQRSADPELVFELRPGADLWFDGVTLKIPATHVRVSSQGTRGPELVTPKPAGKRRLVCIGDSVAFGWGVGEQQSTCAVLASTLGPEWEPVNLGVPGYGAAQKRRQLELRGLPLQPDLVLAQFDQNDRDPPDPQAEDDSVWAWMVDHSAVFRFVHIHAFLSRDDSGDGEGGGPEDSAPAFDGEAAVRTEFANLALRCQSAGVPLVVVLRATEQDGPFVASLTDAGVPVVDVGPALRGAPPEVLEIPGDGHPTAEGHRRMAAAVLPAVRAALTR